MAGTINLVVLLSGGGTTLGNILDHIENKGLPARVGLVISSRPGAKGLEIARNAGIRAEVVDSSEFAQVGADGKKKTPDWSAMSSRLNDLILPLAPNLVCMAGFLSRYILPERLCGKVMNIHPSLIPAFCGQGMHGSRVHEAVVRVGARITGCTVHFANNEYDAGPIILQRACPVFSADTAEEVAKRVFREECEAYPLAIRLFAEGRLRIVGNRVVVADDENLPRCMNVD